MHVHYVGALGPELKRHGPPPAEHRAHDECAGRPPVDREAPDPHTLPLCDARVARGLGTADDAHVVPPRDEA